MPVNIIKRRDTWNCSASTASSEKCQYVMVYLSVYDCVAAYTCERNSIQKHLYLFRIEPIKWYITICGSIRLCISVCGCGYLSKQNNEKIIRKLEQLAHAVMCGNMRWSFFPISVCGCGYLLRDHNQETIGTVAQLSHQDMSVNMCYSDSSSLSVWIQTLIN